MWKFECCFTSKRIISLRWANFHWKFSLEKIVLCGWVCVFFVAADWVCAIVWVQSSSKWLPMIMGAHTAATKIKLHIKCRMQTCNLKKSHRLRWNVKVEFLLKDDPRMFGWACGLIIVLLIMLIYKELRVRVMTLAVPPAIVILDNRCFSLVFIFITQRLQLGTCVVTKFKKKYDSTIFTL